MVLLHVLSTVLPESIHSLVVIDFVLMTMPGDNISGFIICYLNMTS